MVKLNPAVGYTGGKRRLLPFLRPYLPIEDIHRYVEPFVGMGAVYLDLRARGFNGPAILAERIEWIADFWRVTHNPKASQDLLLHAHVLEEWPPTEDGFWHMMENPCEGIVRVCRGLWLTNYMFANLPPEYIGNKWIAPRSSGTKLKSAAKWGKKFRWDSCAKRLSQIVTQLHGTKCEVYDDGIELLKTLSDRDTAFCDPPYENKAKYISGSHNRVDYVGSVFRSGAERIILTEMSDTEPPDGWSVAKVSVLSRQAGPWNGSGSNRKEYVYSNFVPNS